MAACTSRAAASILRFRSNCSVIDVATELLDEVISRDAGDAPELPLERSRDRRGHGLRTGAGQIRHPPDGREIDLRQRRHRQQAKATDTRQQQRHGSAARLPTGRRMNGAERFIVAPSCRRAGAALRGDRALRLRERRSRQTVEVQINDRRGVERQQLAETIRPPTIVIPSGRRSSDPVPVPSASGSPPSSAAIVVIMMGRKRSRHA